MEATVADLNIGSKNLKSFEFQQRKKAKYDDSDPNLSSLKQLGRPCSHDTENVCCNSVTWSDISENRKQFYFTSNKENQDKVLMLFMSVSEPTRRRAREDSVLSKPREVSVKFFMKVTSENGERMVPVCKSFFSFAFGVSKARLLRIGKVINSGSIPTEKRGGDRKTKRSADKREAVRDFLNNLKCCEMHYGRNESRRSYLSSDLSISKLHQMYEKSASPEVSVTFPLFYKIFVNDFNIGFSSPASDACATCTRLKNEIKLEPNDTQRHQNLTTEYHIHKMRADAFYKILKEVSGIANSAAFVFDLQQVQPLPKTPIEDAICRRQIGLYAVGCVPIDSNNPTFYTWTEVQAGRGGFIQIGSAVLHHLKHLNLKTSTETIFLFCNGCGGQSKNAHILHLLSFWLKKESPEHLQKIQITFPVRGHGLLPAEKAFGRVEKLLKKIPEVKSREEYEAVYRKVGLVKQLGRDWNLYNMKELEDVYRKIDGINQAKKVIIKKCKMRQGGITTNMKCLVNYRFECSLTDEYKSIVKKGKHEDNLRHPSQLPLKHPLSKEKKKDVLHLLKTHYGDEWRNISDLQWYKTVLDDESDDEEEEAVDADFEEMCDCLDEECSDIHI